MPKKYLVVVIVLIVAILAVAAFFIAFQGKRIVVLPQAPEEPMVIDDLPVWLLKDGKVAVYREITVDKTSVSQQIVVRNTSSQTQTAVPIYETIPKEIAQKASDLEFTVQPQIIEEDPVVLWSVDRVRPGESVNLGFKVKGPTQGEAAVKALDNFWTKCLRPDLEGLERYKAEEKELQEVIKKLEISNDEDTRKAFIASCLRWWRAKYEKAQKQAQNLQQAKDETAQIVQPTDSQYKNIQQQAKAAIASQETKAQPAIPAIPATPASPASGKDIPEGSVCAGDSDCSNWVCNNCVLGRKVCNKGECVACTYDGHCKDGYQCQNNQCKAKQSATPATPAVPAVPATPPPAPKPTAPVCGQVNLTQGTIYTYAKQASPCTNYLKQVSAGQLSLRCNASAQWRNYWVKQIEVGATSKLKIKASLALTDYAHFFTECSGNGIKSDNYVSFMALSTDPRQSLGLECNRNVSEADWPKCAVSPTGANVLAQCGVAKCTTSKQCNLEVNTAGQDFVYLVFHVSDAWLADIEGGLSSLELCSE
jgi:hypothetical protein